MIYINIRNKHIFLEITQIHKNILIDCWLLNISCIFRTRTSSTIIIIIKNRGGMGHNRAVVFECHCKREMMSIDKNFSLLYQHLPSLLKIYSVCVWIGSFYTPLEPEIFIDIRWSSLNFFHKLAWYQFLFCLNLYFQIQILMIE